MTLGTSSNQEVHCGSWFPASKKVVSAKAMVAKANMVAKARLMMINPLGFRIKPT
jgi:hypothetical protein